MGNRYNVQTGTNVADSHPMPDPRESGKPFYLVVGLFQGAAAPTIYYPEKAEAETEAQRLATGNIGKLFGVAEVQTIARTAKAELVALKA